jgi:hypothetical protein
MDTIFLHIESASRPGVRFTDAANFLFHKRRKLAKQNLLPLLGTADKVIGQFVGDVFHVRCIHTRHYNKCSHSCEVPVGATLPPLERWGMRLPSPQPDSPDT